MTPGAAGPCGRASPRRSARAGPSPGSRPAAGSPPRTGASAGTRISRQPGHYPASPANLPWLLELADDGARRHGLTDLDAQPGHSARLVRGQRLLHLHGLEHDDGVARRRPARRLPPTIFTIVPCMGLTSSSPRGALPPRGPRPAAAPRAFGRPGARGTASPGAKPRRQADLQPLAANLDGDPLARPASAAARRPLRSTAGGRLSNSVSIHRVCTRNGPVRERRVVDHRAVERQHGRHAVDLELGQRPAGRAPAPALRSRPVTISLAISESNACGTVWPARVAGVQPDAGAGRLAASR